MKKRVRKYWNMIFKESFTFGKSIVFPLDIICKKIASKNVSSIKPVKNNMVKIIKTACEFQKLINKPSQSQNP